MRIPVPLVLVLMAATGASVWWLQDAEEPGDLPGSPGGRVLENGDAPKAEDDHATTLAHLRSRLDENRMALDLTSVERDDLRKQNADLEAEVKKLQARIEELKEKLAPHEQAHAKTIAEVLSAIDALKKNGLAAFRSPGATSQLVSDLRALGDQGLEAVMAMLESEDEDERFLAAKLLEELGNPAAANALRKVALEDSSELVQNMASHALALMDDPSVIPALRELATSASGEGARVNSLFGLCKHGDAEGIRLAMQFMEGDASDQMKAALGTGILILDNEHVMPLADDAVRRFRSSDQVLGMAVNYYKTVHTATARSRLQDMVADPGLSGSIHNAAQAALQGW
jgi:HEAT repeat protein